MRPRVVITLGGQTRPAVVEQYVRYVEDSGGEAIVVMPGQPVPEHDGLLLGGGADVDPSHYGQPPHPTVKVEPERDALELPLARRALAEGCPVLGICRGFQMLNIVAGGSLVQHLEGHARDEQGQPRRHRARIAEGSRLREILGKPDVLVNSSHHQAVRAENLAPGLTPTATTEDGLIEAFEADGLLAVQWHPERVDELDPENRAIGRAFVESLIGRLAVGAG